MSRIGRFLLCKEWEVHFPGVTQSTLLRSISNHCPILLSFQMVDWGPKPFPLQNGWLMQKEFMPMVKEWWFLSNAQGYAGFRLFKKLQDMKGKIREWSREVFRNLEAVRDQLVREVEELDRDEEESSLLWHEMEARCVAMSNLWRLNRMEKAAWRQKSRMLWLKEGDRNTKFLHSMANARRKINHIGRLRRGGTVIERPADIKEEVANFFENLYKVDPRLDGVSFPLISVENLKLLERDFEEEEVERALAECGSDKALRPDGFNFRFIKAGWCFLKKEFIEIVQRIS